MEHLALLVLKVALFMKLLETGLGFAVVFIVGLLVLYMFRSDGK